MPKTEIFGEEPHQYSHQGMGNLTAKAVVQHYDLITGDSFEVGSAYSLHRNETEARSFVPDAWWRKTGRLEPVFVSHSTLNEIMEQDDKTLFESSEN